MNAKYKKCMKIGSLLITALIIGTVSAATYNYMYLTGSVTIGGSKLVWIAGADTPGDTTIVGATVTMDLDVQNGTAQNFTEALFLKNQDTANHPLNITVTTAMSGVDFTTANAYIYTNSTGDWVYVDTLTLTSASDQYSGTLNQGVYYRFTFAIEATPSASGAKSFVLQVTYT